MIRTTTLTTVCGTIEVIQRLSPLLVESRPLWSPLIATPMLVPARTAAPEWCGWEVVLPVRCAASVPAVERP